MSRSRCNKAEAEAVERRILALRAAHPKMPQHEIGRRVGRDRHTVQYYLTRGEKGPRKKRGRKPLRRTEYYVAIRATAIRAAREAFPHLTFTEIADALGFTRSMVKHVLLGRLKSATNRRPPWAELLFEACRALAGGQPSRAAEPFERLARSLCAQSIEQPRAA